MACSPAIAITATEDDTGLVNQANQLSHELGLPFLKESALPSDTRFDYAIQVSPYGEHDYHIALKDLHSKASPVCVDFSGGYLAHRRRFGGGRRQALARAIGIKPGITPDVVDATAGLGRGAFVLASLGCKVTMIERSPVLACLVNDALRRAGADPDIGHWIQERLHLLHGDAKQILGTLGPSEYDVIYMDPMYPHRIKSALVKKEMRIIRSLIGDDPDADELLETCLALAKHKSQKTRIVVKRPQTAPLLSTTAPTFEIKSKTTRYDIYLNH